jgi:hypothetical protein
MFRRPESLRERTLLKIIERQERTITDLIDRNMYLAGRPWEQAPVEHRTTAVDDEFESPTWSAAPEQDAKY